MRISEKPVAVRLKELGVELRAGVSLSEKTSLGIGGTTDELLLRKFETIPEVMRLLKERGAGEVAVFGGGIIPDEDAAKLKAIGVRQIFTPGASTEDIVKWVRENVAPR